MDLPRISIVTPSFNQVGYIEATICSVLDQHYGNLEYIVIDGGSSDGSADIIHRYSDHLAHFASESDRGHGNALNKGFQRSTGEIMGWLNSDDMYLPWTFRTVAEIFTQHPDVDWIVGNRAGWNDRGTLLPVVGQPRNIFDFLDGDYQWIQQESVFWRRRLWEKSGGFINEDYKFMVDGELWSRFFLSGYLWNANCIISGYRFHPQNRAQTHREACLAEMEQVIKVLRQRVTPSMLAGLQPGYPFLIYDTPTGHWTKRTMPRQPRKAGEH